MSVTLGSAWALSAQALVHAQQTDASPPVITLDDALSRAKVNEPNFRSSGSGK